MLRPYLQIYLELKTVGNNITWYFTGFQSQNVSITSWYGKQHWEIGAKMKANVLFTILQNSPNNPFVHRTNQVKKSLSANNLHLWEPIRSTFKK